jgi:acylphosphatase
VQIRFTGRVQGVGFRATARAAAANRRVTGWVRNEPDGSVLMEVQGDAAEVSATLDTLRQAMARNIQAEHAAPITDIPAEAGFVIR